nr:VanW family protein [Oscillospiraceae bacterium]
MANGKFSKPRPNREEEREIEKAFRQVTGQEAPPQPAGQAFHESDPVPLDLLFDEDPFPEATPPEVPAEEEPADFVDKAAAFFNKAMDFFEQNRKMALVCLCGTALVLILGFIGILLASSADPYDKTILNNVMIADVNVGGMTKEEAISAVQQGISFSSNDMVVNLAGTELRLAPADTDISLDVKAAVNAAYDYGRTGTKAEQEQAYQNSLTGSHIIGLLPYLELDEEYILQTLTEYAAGSGSALTQPSYGLDGGMPDLKSKDFDPESKAPTLVIRMGVPGIHFDAETVYEEILDAYSLHRFLITIEDVDTVSEPEQVDLEAIFKEFYVEPVNATIDLRTYEVVPGTYGCGFDMEDAQKRIDKAAYGEEVRIPMAYIAPTILDEDMFFQDVLAEYKNSYQGAVLEKNLQAACNALNDTVINPGEEFSFNEVVGERTSDKGYRYATDLTGLEETTSLGGGISQVSSVLYYCALVADMDVTHRTSHPLIPGYSDYGLDAMVGWRTPDFKFTNSTGFPIRIEAEARGGQISIAIVGTDERNYHVAMDYEITGTKTPRVEYETFKANNKEGYKDGDVIREGVTGYSVKTYKLKYDNATGELISRDFVANTSYKSVNKLVARVEKPEETSEATQPAEEETKPEEEATTAPTDPPATQPTEPEETEEAPPAATTPKETVPDTTESPLVQEPPGESQGSDSAAPGNDTPADPPEDPPSE